MIFLIYYAYNDIPTEDRINALFCGIVDAHIFFLLMYVTYYAFTNLGAWI